MPKNQEYQLMRQMKVKKYDPTKNRLENELTVSALKLKLDNVQGTILLKWNSFKIAQNIFKYCVIERQISNKSTKKSSFNIH